MHIAEDVYMYVKRWFAMHIAEDVTRRGVFRACWVRPNSDNSIQGTNEDSFVWVRMLTRSHW